MKHSVQYGLMIAAMMLSAASGTTVTFTGIVDNDLLNPYNWDLGTLPTKGVHTGVVPVGSGIVTFSGDLAGLEITFQGDTQVRSLNTGKWDVNNSDLVFEGSSSLDVGGVTIVIADNSNPASLILSSSGSISNINFIEVGDAGQALIVQNDGTVNVGGALQMEGANAIYTLAGGTLKALALVNWAPGAYFNFTSISTGTAIFTNGGADYTGTLESYIDNGRLRIEGALATSNDFEISYDGGLTTLELAVNTFEETIDNDLRNPANWSDGMLPDTYSLAGVVPNGFIVAITSNNASDPASPRYLDNLGVRFKGNSTLMNNFNGDYLRIRGCHLLFEGESSFDNIYGSKIIVGYDYNATVEFDSTGAWTNFSWIELGGSGGHGTFIQRSGILDADGKVEFNSAHSTYILSGGTLKAGRLEYSAAWAYLDFDTSGPTTGTVEIVRPDDYTTPLAAWIASGNIRLNGEVVTTDNFLIQYDGSKTAITPGEGVAYEEQTHFVGPGANLQDAANWDNGLPNNELKTGVVDDMAVVLDTDAYSAGRKIVFRGSSSVGHGVTSGYRINGNSVWTFEGSSTYAGGTDYALTLGYDTPARLVFNSSGSMTMQSLYLGGTVANSADAEFLQQRGLVMINSGNLNFSDETGIYTLSGGTLRIAGGLVFDGSGDGFLDLKTSPSPGTVMFLDKDYTTELTARIGAGRIRIDGAAADVGDFEMLYDDRHTYLSVSAASYSDWAANWASGNLGFADEDYDGDGLSDLAEYALGGIPDDPAYQGTLPSFSVNGNMVEFMHPQRTDDANLSYVIETTDDLVNTPFAPLEGAVAITNGTDNLFEFVTTHIPVGDQHYFRLRISNGSASTFTYPNNHFYRDDFSDEAAGAAPSHWLQSHGTWVVTSGNELAPVSWNDFNVTLLHAFSRDCSISADVKISQLSPDGKVYLTGRWNYDPGYFIKAGYDHTDNKWKIVQSLDSNKITIDAQPTSISLNQVYRLALELDGNHAALLVDGVEVCSGTLGNMNWGKVGFYSQNSAATFDNVVYEGTGRVEEGVEDYWAQDGDGIEGHGVFFEWNGRLHIAAEDGGSTYICPLNTNDFGTANWLDLTGKKAAPSTRILSMKNGKLVSFIDKKNPKRWSCRFLNSPLGSWSTEVEIFQPGETYPDLSIMPNKYSQTEDGDLWFPSGLGNEGALRFGDTVLHKSEDYGLTWTKQLEFLQDSDDPGMNGIVFGEGEVIEKSNNDLVWFGRRHQDPFGQQPGSHGMITSTDDGDTWELPPRSTPFFAARSSFNSGRDPDSGEIFFIWVYEDSRASPPPRYAQPRHRVSLASSRDDMQSWQFLLDIDDWKGQSSTRHYNPTIYVTPTHLYIVIKTRDLNIPDFNGVNGKEFHYFRIDRSKLRPHALWPSTHSTSD